MQTYKVSRFIHGQSSVGRRMVHEIKRRRCLSVTIYSCGNGLDHRKLHKCRRTVHRNVIEPMCKGVLEACVLGVVYDAPRGV